MRDPTPDELKELGIGAAPPASAPSGPRDPTPAELKELGALPGGFWQDTKDTAAITAAGAVKGMREAGNPLNYVASAARLTAPGLQGTLAEKAMAVIGTSPDKIAAWAERNAPDTDPLNAARVANPMAFEAFKNTTGLDIAQNLKDPEAAYKATGAEKTPLRKALATGAEIAGGALPAIGAGPVGLGLKLAGASAVLGAGGEAIADEPGKVVGTLAALPLALRGGRVPPPAVSVPTERQTSEALSKTLQSVYQKERALVTPDIEAVKAGLKNFSARGGDIDAYIAQYTGPLSAERKRWLDAAGLSRIQEATGATPRVALNELDDILSSMKKAAREMPPGTAERAEVEKFVGHMQEGMSSVVPGMAPAYRQYAQFKSDFEGNKRLGNLYARNPDRTPKVPPSEAGEKALRLPAEGRDALMQYPAIRDAILAHEKTLKVDLVRKAIHDAKLSAPNFSASGYENAIRIQFKQMAKNPEKMALFSPAEVAAIEKIAEGGSFTNFVRNIGRTAPAGSLMKGLYGTGILTGLTTGNIPLALATLGAAGTTSAARVAARAKQSARANLLEDLVARGGPMPPPPIDSQFMVRALRTAPSATGSRLTGD